MPICVALNPTSDRFAQRGLARLEFALTVLVAAVLVALALAAVSHLQVAGDEARRVTVAAQQRSASALIQARCQIPRTYAAPPDCPPCPPSPVSPADTSKPGTAPSADTHPLSCQ